MSEAQAVSTAPAFGPSDIETQGKHGLRFKRLFTKPGLHPFDEIEWELRTTSIQNEKGKVIFEQRNVEVPKDWSETATNIVASKYFHGKLGTAERESSVKQLISRVADTIAQWGVEDGYFRSEEDARAFHDELLHLLVRQKASFNSPVWFNCGLWHKYHRSAAGGAYFWDPAAGEIKKETEAYRHPQCSACFINSVEDNLESILELAKTEGMLFRYGSGSGTNLSTLRSSSESLSGGGMASGPLSFMKGYDAFAGVIKSGGKTRRAAKMVILNIDHPHIEEFIQCKVNEERKAWALVDAGYDPSLGGEAYSSIFFQNANNSVRVTDDFMKAVVEDKDWVTHGITTGEPAKSYRARDLMKKIAVAAWQCGDPGMQFHTTINKWHTSKATAPINASNPCSEYMFLDDSACNLASLNLMKFLTPDGKFDVEAFRHAVDVMITAQEILVDNATYPTARIARNSHDFRPLGLGYANLGAVLMASGLPYDSDAGRDVAAAITAVMHGEAYLQSSRIAEEIGPFAGYAINRDPFLGVISMHCQSLEHINPRHVPVSLRDAAKETWDDCLASGMKHGYRNAQVTVLAPTGTIGFMMDCDTTGIEPDLALVKYKKLVGGGLIKIVNNVVPTALVKLGYSEEQTAEMVNYIDRQSTIEGAPHLNPEHLPVFDCSLKPANGKRSIHYMGHVRMMAAVQPFLSGAISKTVNMPEEATADDIANVYVEGWRLGLKAIAIYRDGSKRTQPLNTKKQDSGSRIQDSGASAPGSAAILAAGGPEARAPQPLAPGRPYRRKLADERRAITHKFSIGGHEGYLTVGLYEEGLPGEIFITMAKEGSTVSGLMDSFATAISLALQYGVPLKVLCDKFSHSRFEPSGWTPNPDIRMAKSVMDYIFRWLAIKFLAGGARPPEEANGSPLNGISMENAAGPATQAARANGERATVYPDGSIQPSLAGIEQSDDAPSCPDCGHIKMRNGASYQCMNCGSTTGSS
ncbi:MAG: vitamin B12-dependent ribonucleotide reductase [Terriglobia bacterium]|jgi:ribonucleoside-diphosphate reductase alpha chain